jgi:hypothetical protein
LKSAEYKTSLPGAPDGEYVVLIFNTVFENKKAAVETVTMTPEKRRVEIHRLFHPLAPW